MMARAAEVGVAEAPGLAGKWRSLWLLSLAELLGMALWFSASAVVPQLTAEWGHQPDHSA